MTKATYFILANTHPHSSCSIERQIKWNWHKQVDAINYWWIAINQNWQKLVSCTLVYYIWKSTRHIYVFYSIKYNTGSNITDRMNDMIQNRLKGDIYTFKIEEKTQNFCALRPLFRSFYVFEMFFCVLLMLLLLSLPINFVHYQSSIPCTPLTSTRNWCDAYFIAHMYVFILHAIRLRIIFGCFCCCISISSKWNRCLSLISHSYQSNEFYRSIHNFIVCSWPYSMLQIISCAFNFTLFFRIVCLLSVFFRYYFFVRFHSVVVLFGVTVWLNHSPQLSNRVEKEYTRQFIDEFNCIQNLPFTIYVYNAQYNRHKITHRYLHTNTRIKPKRSVHCKQFIYELFKSKMR